MQICQSCGEPVELNQSFCKNCGSKISLEQDIKNTETQTRNNRQKKTALPTSIKWIIPCVIVILIALFGAHTYLSNLYKPEKTIASFEKAVNQKDYHTLRKIFSQNGEKLDITDQELAAYITFLINDKSLKETVNELKKTAAGMKYYRKGNPVTDGNGNNLLLLEKGSKLFGVYQQYIINVYPFTIKAETNTDNTFISINGKRTKQIKNSKDQVTLGNFLPGDYVLEADFKGDFVTLSTKKKVDFKTAENNTVIAKINMDGHFVSIYSNGDGAELFVNGKNTGKKVGEIDSFGPVPIDSSVELYAVLNRDGGPIKSTPVKITGEGEVYLEFKEITSEQKKAETRQTAQDALNQYGSAYASPQMKMQTFMDDYLSASIYAINARDFSLVESYLAPTGKQYAESKNYIKYLESKGITESYISLSVLNMENTDTGFKVKTREEYYIYYNDGSMKDKTFESNYTLFGDKSGLKILTLDSTNELSATTLE